MSVSSGQHVMVWSGVAVLLFSLMIVSGGPARQPADAREFPRPPRGTPDSVNRQVIDQRWYGISLDRLILYAPPRSERPTTPAGAR